MRHCSTGTPSVPEARVQLSIDFPVCLRQQISEMLGDGFTRQSSHGFWTLVWVSGYEFLSRPCLFCMHANR